MTADHRTPSELDAIEEAYQDYLQARMLTEAGNHESARELFLLSASKSDHFKTHHMLYSVCKILGRHEESFAHLAKAYELNRRNDRPAVDYAIELIARGNRTEGRRVLEEVLERNGSYRPAKEVLLSLEGNQSI